MYTGRGIIVGVRFDSANNAIYVYAWAGSEMVVGISRDQLARVVNDYTRPSLFGNFLY